MPDPRTDPTARVFRRGLALLGQAVRWEPGIFTAAVLASAVYGGMTTLSAVVIGRVTDAVVVPAFSFGQARPAALALAFAAIVAVALLKAGGIVGRRLLAGIMQYRLQARLRRAVTRQYLRLPLAWHQAHPTGQLLSNANSDVEAAWYPIAPLPMATGVLVMLVTAGVAMVLTDPVLSLVGLAVFPSLFLLNVWYQRRLSPAAMRAQQLRAEVSEVAHESFDGALIVKVMGQEEAQTTRFADVSHRLRDANIDVGRARATFDPILEALPNLGVLVVLLAGAARVRSGAMDAGGVVQVAYLFLQLAFPVRAIGWVLGQLPPAVVGWDRVRAVLDAQGAMHYGERRLPASGPARLAVEGATFAYEGAGGSEPALRDVTLDVLPGQTVAVVGPTGSGKSTLTTLLVRLVDPTSGDVLLDGVNVRELAPGQLSNDVAVVPQQTFLFGDSVRANVTLGVDVADDEVWQSLRACRADGFVAALPDGLDTVVGERGASLSGGQRQRLALARAVVRRPRLLVLDDATSAVDPSVEAGILEALRERASDVTVVVVAYRRATISLADEVVYVEQGRVADRGRHEELLERSPGYRAVVTAYEQRDETVEVA
ncbi:MAG: ABC transporter ATP-binding protein [Actinomycetes bacterium]